MKNKEIEHQFKSSPYIARFRRIAYVAPLVIICVSIWLSVTFSDWGLFSRSGSLVILVGIYVAYYDFSGKIYQRVSHDGFSMSEFFEIGSLSKFSDEELKEFAQKAREAENTREHNRKFSNYVSEKFIKMEVILVSAGTFISGFGDLIFKLIVPFNA